MQEGDREENIDLDIALMWLKPVDALFTVVCPDIIYKVQESNIAQLSRRDLDSFLLNYDIESRSKDSECQRPPQAIPGIGGGTDIQL